MRVTNLLMITAVALTSACGASSSVTSAEGDIDTVGGMTTSTATSATAAGTTLSPGITPVDDPDPSSEAPERATGTGTVTVDDQLYEVEVISCGWRQSLTSEPLAGEENSINELQALAIEPLGEDGFFAIEFSHAPDFPLLTVTVVRLVASAESGNYLWANDRQNPRRVVRDGNRYWTPEPLIVLEDPVDMFSTQHEVTFDIVCESYGGSSEDIMEVAAEVTGLHFGVPPAEGTGTVVVAGETFKVATTTCDHIGDDYSLVAESGDGSLTLVLTISPLPDKIFVEVEGERLVNDNGQEIIVGDDVLSSPGPVPLVGQLSGEPAGEVTFEVTCG